MQLIDIVFDASDKKIDNRTSYNILAHLMEEVGELATEVNIDFVGYKTPGEDGVIGEAVDVILCALDLIRVNYPTVTKEQLNTIAQLKCDKWLSQ